MQTTLPNVLVFVPLAPVRPRIYGRTLQSVLRQDYPRYRLVLEREDMGPGATRFGYRNIADKYNRARALMLAGGDYDYLWTVEADMIVPEDALPRLIATSEETDADVVYGVYASRHGSYPLCVARSIAETCIWFAHRSPEWLCEAWGHAVETQGLGLGCTLIRRRVLESIAFRYDGDLRACDWTFALDCKAAGHRQVHDFRVLCGHITMTPSPRIIWPQQPDAEGRWYRLEFLDLEAQDGIRNTV